jgi:hypothetical protein
MATAKEWFDIWRDNSNPFDIEKGIISFSRYLFPRQIEPQYGVPELHKEMYFKTLQLLHPDRKMALDRQIQFEISRDAAKSTVGSFIFPLYLVCMNGHQIIIADSRNSQDPLYDKDDWRSQIKSLSGVATTIRQDVIMLFSETHAMAENWTMKIRKELSSNSLLKTVFGSMKPGTIFDDEGKWTASTFVALKNKTTTLPWQQGRDVEIVAKGVNQQARGYNTLGRITCAIFDDLYSAKTVITVETRQKTRNLVQAEVKNGIDGNNGMSIFIGTVVHEDTIMIDNEHNRRVEVIKHCAMDKKLFMHVVDNYCKIDSEKRICLVPTEAECKALEAQGFVTIWPERLSLYMLLSKYSESFEGKQEKKTLSMFWQEMFHETLSEEDKKFRRNQMKDLDFDLVVNNVDGNNITYVKIPDGKDGKGELKYIYRNVNTCIAVDTATSYKTGADDSALVWLAIDYYGRIYFYKFSAGKYGINDTFKKAEDEQEYINKLCTDRKKIERVGTSDELFRWVINSQHKYRLSFVIETNSVGNEATRAVYRKMRQYGVSYPVIEVVTSQVKKEDRIADELSGDFQAGMVYFNSNQNWEELKNQLEYLGKTSKDDLADASAIGRANITRPNQNLTELMQPTTKQLQTIAQKLGFGKVINDLHKWRTS